VFGFVKEKLEIGLDERKKKIWLSEREETGYEKRKRMRERSCIMREMVSEKRKKKGKFKPYGRKREFEFCYERNDIVFAGHT
jgi:hypothetical protein